MCTQCLDPTAEQLYDVAVLEGKMLKALITLNAIPYGIAKLIAERLAEKFPKNNYAVIAEICLNDFFTGNEVEH